MSFEEPVSLESPASPASAVAARGGKIITQSAYVFSAQVFGLCCGVASNVLIAWMLGPVGKGSFYLIQLIGTLGQIFLNFGLGPAAIYHLQRGKSYSEAQVASSVLWSSWVLGIFPCLAFAVIRPWLGIVAGSKLSPYLLLLAVIAIPGMVVLWNAGYLSLARGSIASFNFLRSGQSLLFLGVLTILLITHKYTIFSVAFSWMASIVSLAVLAPIIVRPWNAERTRPSLAFIRKAFRFGFHSHLGLVTQYLQTRVDGLLVSVFCPLRDVGIYSLAISLAELLWYVPNTVAHVLISHVAQRSDEDANRLTSRFCRVTLAITALLAVLLTVAATWIIPILLPPFRESLRVLWLFLPGTVSGSVFKVLSSDLNGRGRPGETVRPAATALLVCFLVNLIVIPRFGILAAAIVTSGGYLLNTILYVRTYARITTVRPKELLLVHYSDLMVIRSSWKNLAPR